jgi:hypothetical protein
MFRARVLLAGIFALALVNGRAQTPDRTSLRGRVIDATGAPVPGADVLLVSPTIKAERTIQSDGSGDFAFAALPAGATYTLLARKQGFKPARLTSVTVGGDIAAEVTIQLDISGKLSQVTVTGVVGQVRTDAPQLSDRIIGQQLQETPMVDRRVTFLPLLDSANKPAINQGDIFTNQFLFTTNGAGRRQTTFSIDGATGNESWGRQTLFSSVPLAAVQEVDILNNTFSAQYGGAGTAVSLITRSGGQQFRGQFIEAWRPAATQAALSGFTRSNASSGNDYTANTMGQTALAFSGPVPLLSNTYFTVAAEYTREDRASPITSPIAARSFHGRYRGWLGFVRLDHRFNDRNSLFARADLDSFFDTNPNGMVGGNTLPSVARVFHRRTYSAAIGETAVLTPNLLNEVRLQFQLASPVTQFSPEVYGTQFQVPISSGGTFVSGSSQSASLLNHQAEISDTASYVVSRHVLRWGGSALFAHSGGNSKEFGGPIYLGQFIYNTCTESVAFCESPAYLNNIGNVRTYTQSYGNANYTVNDVQWSAFLQDDFHIRRDLTLNLGLRYEQQTFSDYRKGFGPRAGFSYDIAGHGTTVLRGGFGIYYSQLPDNLAANYALSGPQGVFNYSAGPGQIGFPASIAAVPLPAFPAGAQMPSRTLYLRPGRASELAAYLPTSTLLGYPDQLLNPYSEQWTVGVERRVANGWTARLDYVGSHTLRINRPLDIDPPSSFVRTAPNQVRSAQAANCSRPYWVWWYTQRSLSCDPVRATNPQPPYSVIQTDVNDGYSFYDALQANLSGHLSHLTVLASYTWSHAIDNVDPDVPGQNPNDPRKTGREERGDAIFDQRQRAVLSGVWSAFWGLHVGGILSAGTGLPFNYITGVNNSGDTGATADRPVIGGAVVGRNAGRGMPLHEFSALLERPITLSEHVRLEPRIEVFNLFNHPNFVGYSGTYGNSPQPGRGFGEPLAGVTNQLEARQVQFQIKLLF